MTNKIGIGVEAQFDASGVERQLNALGQKIAAANKVQFTPFSGTTKADVSKIVQQFEQLRKIQGDLNKRMKDTGQGGANLLTADWEKLYADPKSRARQMRKAFEYSTGAAFQAGPDSVPPPPAPGPQPGHPSPGVGGMATRVAQAGLQASGSAGGVAAGALGTGMSAGFGAGLMGLMGGMLALGVGKVVSGVMEKLGEAEANNIAMDRLKRTLGDVSVSFEALKTVVNAGADNLKITYAEAGQLATQFVKLGNVTAEQYKTINEELDVGVGMSRAFGLDPSQGVGVMGQMRGLGVTANTQESRRFALLIGETIGKAGAFAKADEVMDAIASYATAQTRQNMGAANVGGYAGMFSGMVGSGIPGLDPAGAGALLSRVNAALQAGGAKGEASQFFTGSIGTSMGLNPYQTRMLREGGAFATADSTFGEGSVYERYKGGKQGPGGGTTFLQATLDRLKKQYGEGTDELAEATANHLGVNMAQAMALHVVKPNEMGEMQKYGDLSKLSGNGIGNLSKALYGSDTERQALSTSLMARKDVTTEDKDELKKAMGTSNEREVLARLTAQYDQERTQGSDIRDSKNALDNIKTNLADKLVPIADQMRHGIMYMAGKGEKSPKQIMAEVMALESKDNVAGIKGKYEAERQTVIGESEAIRTKRNAAVADLRKNIGTMTPQEVERAQKNITQLSEDYARKSEEVRLRLLDLMKKEADAIEAETAERDKRIEKMRKENAAADPETTGSINQSPAETSRLGRVGYAPGDGGGGGGGRYYTSGGGMGGAALKSADTDEAMKHFMDKGWTREQASGIVANLHAESRLNAGAVGDGGKAFGIAQWHPDRQADFARWAGKDIRQSTRKEQMDFVHYEMTEGKERAAGERLRRATTPEQSGAIVSRHYERPKWAEAEAAKRAGMANQIMSSQAGARPKAPPGVLPVERGPDLPDLTPKRDMLPDGAAGRSGSAPSYNVSADDITVRVVDANGKPIAPPQQLQTRVQSNWRPSMGY